MSSAVILMLSWSLRIPPVTIRFIAQCIANGGGCSLPSRSSCFPISRFLEFSSFSIFEFFISGIQDPGTGFNCATRTVNSPRSRHRVTGIRRILSIFRVFQFFEFFNSGIHSCRVSHKIDALDLLLDPTY